MQTPSGSFVNDNPTGSYQSAIDSLSTVGGSSLLASTQTAASIPTSGTSVLGGVSPFLWIGVVVVLLVIIKVAMEHEKSGLDPSILGVGTANFIVVGLMATLWIWFEKLIVKWPIPGFTQMVNAL
jgi:hypothetical protein